MAKKFSDLFNVKKPIIGVIHLAGEDSYCRISRALEEISIFEKEGIDGAIVEDYDRRSTFQDVVGTLDKLSKIENKIVFGVNVLGNPYSGFELANLFGARFVKFDNIQTPGMDLRFYNEMRSMSHDVSVLGGVRFKYAMPSGNSLEADLKEGMSRCEAIVTTGEGEQFHESKFWNPIQEGLRAGRIETPMEKLIEFRKIMGNYPLIIGAGVAASNVYEQLSVADGAIVGSYFKNGNTENPVDAKRVRELMSEVVKLR